MKILFLGDVVGSPGRTILSRGLPRLIARRGIDFVVANVENVAGGSGITEACYEELKDSGVDAMTMGDHAYRKDEVFRLYDRARPICRPANYPPDSPGPRSLLVHARDGTPVGVFVVLGRTFMRPVDCPFRASDLVIEDIRQATNIIIADIHAEATSDKQSLGRYLDGRVTAALGTHTHVPTADEQIFPGGTAYQTDVGMTGPYESIVGRRVDRVLPTTITFVHHYFDVATGSPRLCGALVDVDPATGRAVAIERINLSEDDVRRL